MEYVLLETSSPLAITQSGEVREGRKNESHLYLHPGGAAAATRVQEKIDFLTSLAGAAAAPEVPS